MGEKSKRWVELRGRVPRSGTNEGEADRLRVVEIAQRYDLDRPYNGARRTGQSWKKSSEASIIRPLDIPNSLDCVTGAGGKKLTEHQNGFTPHDWAEHQRRLTSIE